MSKQQAVYKIKAVLDVSDIKSNSKAIQNSLAGVKLSGNLKNQFNTLFNDLEREVDSFQQKMNEGFNNAGDIKALQKSANNITKIYSSITKEIEKIGNKDLSQFADFDTTEIKTAKKELQELQKVLNQKLDAAGLNDVNQAIKDIQKVSKNKNIESFLNAFKTGDIETAQKSLEALRKSASGFSNQTNLTTFNAQLDKMEASLRQLETVDGLQDVAKNMQLLKTRIETLNADQIAKVMRYIDGLDTATREAAVAQQQYTDKVLQSASAQNQLNNEIEEVKSRVKYFFTLANGVELFKRAVRDAFETVKELDAAMTETAVVTDFTVGDMWDKLPEYTDAANKLGATIQGAYETMTLFYQQGLDTNEAFALGTETMKMARIAGLEYTDATDLMTAALRGFKMELNEVSAQRVNDVYSELAAISASDTNEIANAMTKTASIANSANMEFETTAAFLTQMIETTREPAENLGTAMKTIIARFTEMKKAPGEIFEFEGEEVNVNKVDAALASVGVSLKNTKGEFRDLDDVFLDLAKNWDSLDIMSQRYVATMAAGSRQQSRFIAMMSDYQRTMELVDAAQNSAGASQKQFEKTQESLEAKINKLKNAWDEFALGLANDKLIKGAVDLLTKFLETVNNITDSENSAINSISKIALAFGGFKLAKDAIGKLETGATDVLAKAMGKAGVGAGEEFGEGVVKTASGKIKAGRVGIADNLKNLFLKTTVSSEAYDMTDAFKQNEAAISSFGQALKNAYSGGTEERRLAIQSFTQIKDTMGLSTEQAARLAQGYKSGATSLGAYTFAITGNNIALENGLDETTAAILMEAKLADERGDSARATSLAAIAEDNLSKQRAAGKINAVTDGITGATKKITDFTAKINNAKLASGGLTGTFKGLGGAIKTSFNGAGAAAKGLLSSLGGLASALAPVLAVAGIIAVITGAIALAHYMATEHVRALEEAEKAMEKATTAAENAKQAYDDLMSTLDGYDSAVDKLKALEKGTIEWNQQLLETNQLVLDILSKYPEMVGNTEYVKRDETTGLLTLTDKGKEYAQTQAINQQANAQQQLALASIRKEKASQISSKEGLEDTVKQKSWKAAAAGTGAGIAAGAGGALAGAAAGAALGSVVPIAGNVLGAIIGSVIGGGLAGGGAAGILAGSTASDAAASGLNEKLLNFYENNPTAFTSENNEELKSFAKEIGMTAEELYEMRGEIEDYANAVNQSKLIQEEQTRAMFTAGASQELLADENSNNYIKAFTNAYKDKDLDPQIKEEMGELGYGKWGYDNVKEQLKNMGITESFKNQTEAITRLYAELTGQTVEDVEELEMSKEELFRAVAEINVSDDISSKMNEFYEKYKDEASAQAVLEAMSQNSVQLSLGELDFTNEAALAESLGISLDQFKEYAEAMELTSDELYTNLQDKAKKGAEKLENSIPDVSSDFLKGALEELKKQSEEEYEIAVSLLETESFTSFRDFLNKISERTITTKIELSISNLDAINNALTELTSKGDLSGLDEESVTEFNNALQQIPALYGDLGTAAQQWNSLANRGTIEQIKYLTDLSQTQSNTAISAVNEAQVSKDAYNNALLKAIELQNKLNELKMTPTSIKVNANEIKKAETELEKLQEIMKSNEWSIDIDISNPYESILTAGEDIINQAKAMREAAELIGEGYKVAAEDVEVLRAKYPLLLADAQVLSDGTVQLKKQTVEAMLAGDQAELESDTLKTSAQIDNAIAKLEAEIKTKQEWITQLDKALNNEVQLDADTLLTMAKNSSTYQTKVQKFDNDTKTNMEKNQSAESTGYEQVGTSATDVATDINQDLTDATANVAKYGTQNISALNNALIVAGKNAAAAANAVADMQDGKSTTFKGGTKVSISQGNRSTKKYTSEVDDYDQSKNQSSANKINSIGALKQQDYKDLENAFLNGTYTPSGAVADFYNSGSFISKKDLKWSLQQDVVSLKADIASLNALKTQIRSTTNAAKDDMKNAAAGLGGSYNPTKDKGSKDKEIKKYIDETDQSYNTLRAIEVENRKQDKLQTAYDNLVENDEASLQDLMDNLADQEASLIEEQALDKKLINERKQQLQKVLSDNKDLQKYASIDWSTGEVNINLNAVKSLEGTSAEEGTVAARYQDYIKDLETASKNYIDAQKDYDATTQDLLELRRTDAKSDFEGARYDNSITWLNAVESELKSAKNEQEILEKEYNALLENRNATGGEIANSLSRQKKNLEQQQALQQELLRLNKYYMQDLLDSNKDLQKYANYNWETGVVEINADAIGKIVNEEEGKRVTEYISELEKSRDQINDANGSLLEIDNSVKEIEKQGQDERLDLEQRVLDALTKQHQDEIDALTELDEDINEASEDFISAMEEAIAKERQERENAEKEQSIRDKETRLAYLKRDTTGGNQQEIKQLEKELADEKQDYSDNLIDQKLEELRKQNDEASEQRQEQIELLQKQLEELQENPDWDEIYRIINSSMAANGTLIKGSELDKLLKENEDYGSKSDVGKDVWEEELDKTFGAAAGYVSNSRQLEKLSDKERGVSKGGKVTFINAEGKKISGTYLGDGQGTVEVKSGGYKYLYTDVYRDYDGTYRQTSATPKGQEINPIPEIKDPKPTKPAQPAKKEEPKKQTAKPATPAKKEQPKKETVSYFSKPSYSGASIVDGLKTSVYGKDTKKWPSNKTLYNKVGTLEQIAKANGITGKVADRNTKMLKKLKEGKLKKYKAFAHGGLVDFTGPAWLDGTKTRPEAFLSADDTKNFMELKDVLSSVKKAQNRNTAVSNNASFVINVKVDKIDNDYDVDRLVSRVKQDILQNSQYRNVTSINFRK